MRGAAALKSGESLTKEQAEVLAGVDLRLIEDLAAYAMKGNFFIS